MERSPQYLATRSGVGRAGTAHASRLRFCATGRREREAASLDAGAMRLHMVPIDLGRTALAAFDR
jgi:hypothetical protein